MKIKRDATAALVALAAIGLAACGGNGGEEPVTAPQGGGEASGTTAPPAGSEKEVPAAGSEGEGRAAAATIVVRNGGPVGGVRELEYGAGEQVRFRVRSDVADEVHVHGYDVSKDVAAGGTVAFSFAADIEGIFEVELEESGEEIAELRVNP